MTAHTTRGRLDRSAIVATALDLLDANGLDALSTRALADQLGVKSPALYWHFKNKRDLVDAMAEQMLDDAPWPAPIAAGDDLRTWLARRGEAFRRALLARRDGARVHAGTRPTASQKHAVESQILALVAAGLAPVDAARGALALSRYIVGWVLEEQAAGSGDRPAHSETEISPNPVLAEAAPVFANADPDGDFTFGLRALLDGVLTRAVATPDTR